MRGRHTSNLLEIIATTAAMLLSALVSVTVPLAAVPSAAQGSQTNSSHRFAPGACGPVDSTYIKIAEESGGQPMFLQPMEIIQAGHFLREMNGGNRETLIWAKGVLQGDSREFTVPVDATVDTVTFTMSTNTHGMRLSVFDPEGAEFTSSHAGAQISDLNCSRTVTAAKPEAGTWHVRVSGSGRFWLQAGAHTEIFLTGVEFVEEGGRPGHEGMFRIAGQPLTDHPATLQCNVSGPVTLARFELISEQGVVIQSVEMHSHHQSEDEQEFEGTASLPSEPFRLMVSGTDTAGHAYQRVFHTLFHAESVEVVPSSRSIETLRPGSTTTLVYTVRNVGAAGSFKVTVVDTRNFIVRVEPKDLTLGNSQSARVEVDLAVPPSTPPGTGFDVIVTAARSGTPSTQNGTTQHLSVGSAPQN